MTSPKTKGRISIDRDKCTGCGHCVNACHAGALAMIDGKACLVDENHCDGLGVCIGECPFGAISFSNNGHGSIANHTGVATKTNVTKEKPEFKKVAKDEPLACGCPGHMNQVFHKIREKPASSPSPADQTCHHRVSVQEETGHLPPIRAKSELGAWPIQLHLIRPGAIQFQGADVLIAASCSAFSHAAFHEEMLRGKALVIACPKLDRQEGYLEKLTELFRDAKPRSVTITRMEVPCCQGLTQLVLSAKRAAESEIPVRELTIGLQGDVAGEVVFP